MFHTRSRCPHFPCLCLFSVFGLCFIFPSFHHFFASCFVFFDAFLSDIGIGSGSGVWKGETESRGKSTWKNDVPFFFFFSGLVWFGMIWLWWIWSDAWLDT